MSRNRVGSFAEANLHREVADAFFEKPLDPALLLAKITELLQADKRRGETGLAERSRAT